MALVIYISGPMTGLPEFNYPSFFAAEADLQALGYRVENPARNKPPQANPTWDDWMREAINQLRRCDGVALLPGWIGSRGARCEIAEAKSIGARVMALSDWMTFSLRRAA